MKSPKVIPPRTNGDQCNPNRRRCRTDASEIANGDPPEHDTLLGHLSIHEQSHYLRILTLSRRPSPTPVIDLDAQIKRSADLLLDRQRPDGSIGLDDDRFNPVEPTAHALMALGGTGQPRNGNILRALQFLADQIRPDDGSVRSATNAVDAGWPEGPEIPPSLRKHLPRSIGIKRTYPAALVLIALSRWRWGTEYQRRVRAFLLGEYRSGGWGAHPGAQPRPAFTAIAVHALVSAGVKPSRFRTAMSYLRRSQRWDGRWPEEEEVWSVRSGTGDHIALSTINTTTHCIDALSHANPLLSSRSIARGTRYLLAARPTQPVRPDITIRMRPGAARPQRGQHHMPILSGRTPR